MASTYKVRRPSVRITLLRAGVAAVVMGFRMAAALRRAVAFVEAVAGGTGWGARRRAKPVHGAGEDRV